MPSRDFARLETDRRDAERTDGRDAGAGLETKTLFAAILGDEPKSRAVAAPLRLDVRAVLVCALASSSSVAGETDCGAYCSPEDCSRTSSDGAGDADVAEGLSLGSEFDVYVCMYGNVYVCIMYALLRGRVSELDVYACMHVFMYMCA